MKKRPLFRITLYLLPALLLINILLYAWFARKARETSADEVVQKAYVVSRMLSEFTAHTLDQGELAGLQRVVDEAFKDRHIVAVGITDTRGKVILQSTVPRIYERLSTFETPVKRGEKTVARLVTSFSLDESDEMLSGRLYRTAGLQLVMFVMVAGSLAWLCWREKRALDSPVSDSLAEKNLPANTLVEAPLPAALSAPFPVPVTMESCARIEAFGNAGRSLERAAELLAGEADRHLTTINRARECLAGIGLWRHQALHGRESAESLIASGREIIAMVQGAAVMRVPDRPRCESDEKITMGPAEIAHLLEEIIAALDRLAGIRGKSEDVAPLLLPDESVRLAGELAREGIVTIRQRVFPALASAVGAGENVASRLVPLLERVAECGDRASGLTRCSSELFDLADRIRLLRRDLRPDPSDGDGGEGRLNDLAEQLESISARLKGDSRDLLGVANEAIAAGRMILTAVEDSRKQLLAAGSTVEDAAAVAVMGSDHLQDFLCRSGVDLADGPAATLRQNSLAVMQSLRSRVAALQAGLTEGGESHPVATEDQAQSLAMACDNLLLASRFLAEIVDGAAGLDEPAGGAAAVQETGGQRVGVAVDQLITAARETLGQARIQRGVSGDEPAGGE